VREEENHMVAVILSGGKSRRMGRDKAQLQFAGKPALQILVERYSGYFDVYVGVDVPGRFLLYGAGEVVDEYTGQGPMAGLHAAFAQTGADKIFLTAVDLLHGDPTLAIKMMKSVGFGSDACIIKRPQGIEPMFGAYSRSCFEPAEKLLENGENKIKILLDSLKVKYLSQDELKKWDLDDILFNMNYPDDYKTVLGNIGCAEKN